jgi:hypothetical protein
LPLDILKEICNAFQEAKDTFQTLESSVEDSNNNASIPGSLALSQLHSLAQELGEGGVIEGTLFRLFQLNSLHLNTKDRAALTSTKIHEGNVAKIPEVLIYSEERLKHLLDILTASIMRHICHAFASTIHTRRESFNTLPTILLHSFCHSAKTFIEAYVQMVTKLTQSDLSCLPYPWKGGSYSLTRVQRVLDRLKDLLMMRTVQEEIEILLSEHYIKKNGGTNNYAEPPQLKLLQVSIG